MKKYRINKKVVVRNIIFMGVFASALIIPRPLDEAYSNHVIQLEQPKPIAASVVAAAEPVKEQEDEVVQVAVNSQPISRGADETRYSQADIDLLARVIHGEAGIDSYEGKLAVGTIIMNRVANSNHKLYGGPTISGVIYHKLPGTKWHQFNCVDVPRIWNQALTEDDTKAAVQVLEGYRSFGPEYLCYYNPDVCNGTRGINYDVRVGMHLFGK